MNKTKLLIFSVVFGSIILGTSLNAISFVESSQADLKRVMPAQNAILSYNEAITAPKRSVVNIFTKKTIKAQQGIQNPLLNDPLFRQFFGNPLQMPQDKQQSSLGSGVILTSDGYIVTNNHVIGDADQIMVILPNEKKEFQAKVIGKDPKSDLAVIKIEAANLQPIVFTDSTKLKEGDVVFAIGNPFGIGETITHGIISALGKNGVGINEYEDFIQTDAPINPGNSGGALVDSRGYLIGVNTAIISQTGQSGGIGFAIPSNMVKNIAKQLIENGKIERGAIGITMQDMDEKARKSYGRDGVVILGITPNSAADKAGIKIGDLIIGFNGAKINSSAILKNSVGNLKPGDIIKLDIFRDAKILHYSIKLDSQSLQQSNTQSQAILQQANELEIVSGVFVGQLTDDIKRKLRTNQQNGIVTLRITNQNTPFMIGDIIIKIDDYEITNLADAKTIIQKLGTLNGKRIFTIRQGQPMMIITEQGK